MTNCTAYYYHEPDALDLRIKQRGSWVYSITVIDQSTGLPFDFTGYTPKADFVKADTPIGTAPVLVVSTTAIIPAPTTGVVILSLTKAQCEALNASVEMNYDLFCDNASTGDSRCFVQGSVTVVQRYTAP